MTDKHSLFAEVSDDEADRIFVPLLELCEGCRCARIVRGPRLDEEIVFCSAMAMEAVRIDFKGGVPPGSCAAPNSNPRN